jgi:hypothetical protein
MPATFLLPRAAAQEIRMRKRDGRVLTTTHEAKGGKKGGRQEACDVLGGDHERVQVIMD